MITNTYIFSSFFFLTLNSLQTRFSYELWLKLSTKQKCNFKRGKENRCVPIWFMKTRVKLPHLLGLAAFSLTFLLHGSVCRKRQDARYVWWRSALSGEMRVMEEVYFSGTSEGVFQCASGFEYCRRGSLPLGGWGILSHGFH